MQSRSKHITQGIEFYKKDQFDLAIACFNKELNNHPRNIDAYTCLYQTFLSIKDSDALNDISKDELFDAIKKLPLETQIPLLKLSLYRGNPFGERFYKEEYWWPFSDPCGINKGILADIHAYLLTLEPDFVWQSGN